MVLVYVFGMSLLMLLRSRQCVGPMAVVWMVSLYGILVLMMPWMVVLRASADLVTALALVTWVTLLWILIGRLLRTQLLLVRLVVVTVLAISMICLKTRAVI